MSGKAVATLPQRVMRRATGVALATVLVAVVVGLFGIDDDIDREVTAAMALAGTLQKASQAGALGDDALIHALGQSAGGIALRHVSLALWDGDGRLLLSRRPEAAGAGWVDVLAERHRHWRPGPELTPRTWLLERPGRAPWSLTLAAAPQSERREAIAALVSLLGVLAAGALAMLGVMTWTVRRALQPLAALSQALARIRPGGNAVAATRMPPMPVPELQHVADAVRTLGQALDAAEADRRMLARKVHSLQEDERARLARDLHDEFGQRLTALRLDASLLQRQGHGDSAMAEAVDRIAVEAAHLQEDVRQMLRRLAPRASGDGGETVLGDMLQTLADGWHASAPDGADIAIDLDAAAAARARGDLALAVYRLTQEALTNIARHAQAHQVRVVVAMSAGGGAIDWTVEDDGIGLNDPAAAVARGSGLAGMRERVWAHGGDLVMEPLKPGTALAGLRLSARLHAPRETSAADAHAP